MENEAQGKKYLLTLTTAKELCDLIEAELEKGNPLNTQELWDEFIVRMAKERKVTALGTTSMDAELLAANMREEGLKVKFLKPEQDQK